MDHVVDHSVLAACDALTGAELGVVQDWLADFAADDAQKLLIDHGYALWSQYEALGGQNAGLLVLQQKISQNAYETTAVPLHPDGTPRLTATFAVLDADRRWLAAVATAAHGAAPLVNATCLDWHPSRIPAGISFRVVQLLLGWLNANIVLPPAQQQVHYYAPPAQLQGPLANAGAVGRGFNQRMAWEDAAHRYEFDSRHNSLEVYTLRTGRWRHEARLDGTVLKRTGGEDRRWGRD